MTINKLPSMPYAQATVVDYGNGHIALVSYRTTVLELNGEWLTVHGLYSATTRKHISAFMRDYLGMDYYTAKKAYEGGYAFNTATGEIEFF